MYSEMDFIADFSDENKETARLTSAFVERACLWDLPTSELEKLAAFIKSPLFSEDTLIKAVDLAMCIGEVSVDRAIFLSKWLALGADAFCVNGPAQMSFDEVSVHDSLQPKVDAIMRSFSDRGLNSFSAADRKGLKNRIIANPEFTEYMLLSIDFLSNSRNTLRFDDAMTLAERWHRRGFKTRSDLADNIIENSSRILLYESVWKLFGYTGFPSEEDERIMDMWKDSWQFEDDEIFRVCEKQRDIQLRYKQNNKSKAIRRVDALIRKDYPLRISACNVLADRGKDAAVPDTKRAIRNEMQKLIVDHCCNDFISAPDRYRFMRWVFPTGFGKTYMFKSIFGYADAHGLNMLYISPQREHLRNMYYIDLGAETINPDSALYGLELGKDIVLVEAAMDPFMHAYERAANNSKDEAEQTAQFLLDIKQLFGPDNVAAFCKEMFKSLKGISITENGAYVDKDAALQRQTDEFGRIKSRLDRVLRACLKQRTKAREQEADDQGEENKGYIRIGGNYLLDETEYDVLLKYYPGIALCRAKIVLMTSMKTDTSIEPFGHRTIYDDERLENTIVFIDEVDQLPSILFDSKLKSRKNPKDLFHFFNDIKLGLREKTRFHKTEKESGPYGNRMIESYILQNEYFDQAGKTVSALNRLWRALFDAFDRMPILALDTFTVSIKTEPRLYGSSPELCQFPSRTRLFNVSAEPAADAANTADENVLYLIKDPKNETNLIITNEVPQKGKSEGTDWVDLRDVISMITGICDLFFSLVRIMCDVHKEKTFSALSQEQEVSSVLSLLGLSEEATFVQANLFSPRNRSRNRVRAVDRNDPYAVGCSYVRLEDDGEHYNETYFSADYLKNLPETLLRRLITNAHSCIFASATCNLRSLNNFDFDMIIRLLDEAYADVPGFECAEYTLPRESMERVVELYEKLAVETSVEIVSCDASADDTARRYFERSLISRYISRLSNLEDADIAPPSRRRRKKSDEALVVRKLGALNLFVAMAETMLVDQNAHAAIVFQSAAARNKNDSGNLEKPHPYTEENIRTLTKKINAAYKARHPEAPRKIKVYFGKAKDSNMLKKALTEIPADEIHIIVTAYGSYGAATNFQYTLKGSPDNTYDLDGIAIGCPTNIIGGAGNDGESGTYMTNVVNSKLKRLYLLTKIQNMCKGSLDMDVMTNAMMDACLHRILTSQSQKTDPGDPMEWSMLSPYKQSAAQTIGQAIGRGVRGGNRNAPVHIVVDDTIVNKGYMTWDMFSGSILSPALTGMLQKVHLHTAAKGAVRASADRDYERAFRKANAKALYDHNRNVREHEVHKAAGLAVPEDVIEESQLTRDAAASFGYEEAMRWPYKTPLYMNKMFFLEGDQYSGVGVNIMEIYTEKYRGVDSDKELVKTSAGGGLRRVGDPTMIKEQIDTFRFYDKVTKGALCTMRPGLCSLDIEEFKYPPFTITEDLMKGQLGEDIFEGVAKTFLAAAMSKAGFDPAKVVYEHLSEKWAEDFDACLKDLPVYFDPKNYKGEWKPFYINRLLEKIARAPYDRVLAVYINTHPVQGDGIFPVETMDVETGGKQARILLIHGLTTKNMVETDAVNTARESIREKIESIAENMAAYLGDQL